MEHFQIEAWPRSPAARTLVAYYQVEAAKESAAIEEAMRALFQQQPGKNVANYTFSVIRS